VATPIDPRIAPITPIKVRLGQRQPKNQQIGFEHGWVASRQPAKRGAPLTFGGEWH
jgi:hypothetical protein